jgi:hypothetical protein
MSNEEKPKKREEESDRFEKSSQKDEKICEYEKNVGILEKQIPLLTEEKERNIRHIDLSKGLILGLFYGIIGNTFVQFFYPIIQQIILWKFESSILANIIISAISLAFILYMTARFRNHLRQLEDRTDKVINEIKEKKIVKEDMKEELKELKGTKI